MVPIAWHKVLRIVVRESMEALQNSSLGICFKKQAIGHSGIENNGRLTADFTAVPWCFISCEVKVEPLRLAVLEAVRSQYKLQAAG